jgi:hypothetical protein
MRISQHDLFFFDLIELKTEIENQGPLRLEREIGEELKENLFSKTHLMGLMS